MADSSNTGGMTIGSGKSAPQSSFGGSGKSLPGNNAAQGFTAGGQNPQNQWGANDYVNFTNISYGGLSGFGLLIAMIGQFVLIQKQIDIAQSYYDTNLQDFKFFANNYAGYDVNSNGSYIGTIGPQPGVMERHKIQAFTTPFYTTDYYPMTGAAVARVKIYDEKWLQGRRRVQRYSLGAQRHLDYQYYMTRRKAAFTAWLAGRRVEDARKDWKDEQIQTHKIQALNFGITAGNVARQGLASSTGALEKSYDDLGTRIGGVANGLGNYAGYKAGKDAGDRSLNSGNDGSGIAPHTVGTGPA